MEAAGTGRKSQEELEPATGALMRQPARPRSTRKAEKAAPSSGGIPPEILRNSLIFPSRQRELKQLGARVCLGEFLPDQLFVAIFPKKCCAPLLHSSLSFHPSLRL
jgi:hypothetical protein